MVFRLLPPSQALHPLRIDEAGNADAKAHPPAAVSLACCCRLRRVGNACRHATCIRQRGFMLRQNPLVRALHTWHCLTAACVAVHYAMPQLLVKYISNRGTPASGRPHVLHTTGCAALRPSAPFVSFL